MGVPYRCLGLQLYRVTNPTASIALSGLKAGSVLQLLVENMGRINFSHGMDDDRKGEY